MDFIKDVTRSTFDQDVVQASRFAPVVIDFWAPWCAPCKALKPLLEKLADEYQGAFVLAKIDTDSEPELAARFGIRGIPNVKAILDGKVVSEFSGALPEAGLRQFIAKVVPSAAERHRRSAKAAIAEGDTSAAESLLREALAIAPGLLEARLDLVDALIARNAFTEATAEMDRIPERERDGRAETLAQRIALWERARSLPTASALEARVREAPGDVAARWDLAERLTADAEPEQALAHLLEIVKRDRGEARNRARELMVRIFAASEDQAFVSEYRRLLAGALY